MPTVTEARDAMMGAVKAAWDAGSTTSSYKLYYQDDPDPKPPAASGGKPQPWGRASIRHAGGGQAGFAGAGGRRFERVGVLAVEVLAPMEDGRIISDAMAQEMLSDLEVRSLSGVDLTNVRLQDQGTRDAWSRVDLLADFTYTEVR